MSRERALRVSKKGAGFWLRGMICAILAAVATATTPHGEVITMSPTPHLQDTGNGSFFGEWAYQGLLQRHASHFLVQLARLFDWNAQSKHLITLYQGRGLVGRPPYDPVLIFEMLFLSYLYDVSERAIEEMADLNLL